MKFVSGSYPSRHGRVENYPRTALTKKNRSPCAKTEPIVLPGVYLIFQTAKITNDEAFTETRLKNNRSVPSARAKSVN